MNIPLRTRAALWLAAWIKERADVMRDELRDRIRDETRRIAMAEKRARGLRLYAAWSRPAASRASQIKARLSLRDNPIVSARNVYPIQN